MYQGLGYPLFVNGRAMPGPVTITHAPVSGFGEYFKNPAMSGYGAVSLDDMITKARSCADDPGCQVMTSAEQKAAASKAAADAFAVQAGLGALAGLAVGYFLLRRK